MRYKKSGNTDKLAGTQISGGAEMG